MSKITIKPFLNKKIKPIQVYSNLDELGYPLYYSITYKRKTQYVKSFTGAIMTQSAFLYFVDKKEPLHYETNYTENSVIQLKNENDLICNAVKYITETELIENIFNEDFTPRLKEYFAPLRENLYFLGWITYNHKLDLIKKSSGKSYTAKEFLKLKISLTDDEKRIEELFKDSKNPQYDIENFYYSFDKNKNLLDSVNALEKMIKINIKEYFYINTLKTWYVIDLILKLMPTSIMIEFILNFDQKKIIALNKKEKYPVSNNEIEKICNKLKMNSLGIFSEH